jgi:D-glycero-D-manno-heptose 1,7-bisphosphate phosphatase
MLDLVRHKGGEIEAIFVCPHGPEARCRCRPPLPGLFEQIAERLKINLAGVAAVVTTDAELTAARDAGAQAIRIAAGGDGADGRTSFVSLQSCSAVLLGGRSAAN